MATYKHALYKQALNGFKSDASLLRGFSKGDASAFDSLYARYKDKLFNYLYRQVDQASAAEEIAQEVWMAVIRGSDSFRDQHGSDKKNSLEKQNRFSAWLFAIAYRRCADYWRGQYKNPDTDEHVEPDDTASRTSNPEQYRLVDELHQVLLTLPDDQRQSFALKEEGFSYQEIADMMDTGVETVKSRLRYARKALQKQLEDLQPVSKSRDQIAKELGIKEQRAEERI